MSSISFCEASSEAFLIDIKNSLQISPQPYVSGQINYCKYFIAAVISNAACI